MKNLSIGNVVASDGQAAERLDLDAELLKKHLLICGGSGSGKSETTRTIIKALTEQKIPFLLIQAYKPNYRQFFEEHQKVAGSAAIYTVGSEGGIPLRLNPLEFVDGFPIVRHLAAIKEIFESCFDMYSPMPQVLERVIEHKYELKGWDISHNKNYRLPAINLDCYRGDIFPTLSDLYDGVEPLTNSLGYTDRIGPDVIAALKVRLRSLIAPGKASYLT